MFILFLAITVVLAQPPSNSCPKVFDQFQLFSLGFDTKNPESDVTKAFLFADYSGSETSWMRKTSQNFPPSPDSAVIQQNFTFRYFNESFVHQVNSWIYTDEVSGSTVHKCFYGIVQGQFIRIDASPCNGGYNTTSSFNNQPAYQFGYLGPPNGLSEVFTSADSDQTPLGSIQNGVPAERTFYYSLFTPSVDPSVFDIPAGCVQQAPSQMQKFVSDGKRLF
jgi:hypothetical protein